MRYLNAPNVAYGEDRRTYKQGTNANTTDRIFNVSYDNGRVDVYLNGVKLYPVDDYTKASSGIGSSITLISDLGASNVLECIGYQGINSGNGVTEDRFVVGTSSTGSGGAYGGSTTVFNVSSGIGSLVSVWQNGVKLVHTTDFTVDSGASTVTLGSAATSADEITVQVVGVATNANFVLSSGGTFTGELEVPTVKLSSNIIKASDGGSTITLDTSDNVTIGGSLKTDTISEKTGASGVTVDGVNLKDSAINTGAIGSAVTGFSGIKNADMWYMTANLTSNGDLTDWDSVTANKPNSDKIGAAITEASGIFSFPQTGIYWIILNVNIAGTEQDNIVTQIQTTIDNGSNWVEATYLTDSGSPNGYENTGMHNYLFDVSSITGGTTRKVKFSATSLDSGSYIIGAPSGAPRTTAMFIRLGDT